MVKKRYIPKRLIYVNRTASPTISIRDKTSGHFLGRRKAKKGERDDGVRPLYVGGGTKGSSKYGGWIVGTKSIKVKGSQTARAHKRIIRRTL